LGSVKYCLHFLLGEGVARLQQLFRDVGGIPGLEVGDAQFVLGEGAQFGHVLLGEGLGLGRQSRRKASTCSGVSAILGTSETSAKLRKPSIWRLRRAVRGCA
jgi:hypothetical protein